MIGEKKIHSEKPDTENPENPGAEEKIETVKTPNRADRLKTRRERARELWQPLESEEKSIADSSLGVLTKLGDRVRKNSKAMALASFLTVMNLSTAWAKKADMNQARRPLAAEALNYDEENYEEESEGIFMSPEAFEKQKEELRREIAIYKNLGYEIKVKKGICFEWFDREIEGAEKIFEREMEDSKNPLEIDWTSSPIDTFKYSDARYYPADLNDNGKTMDISPFSIVSEQVTPGKLRIEVYNWLGQNTPVYSQVVAKHELPASARAIKGILDREFQNLEKMQEKIDSISAVPELPKDRKPIIEIIKEEKLTEEQKRDIEEFASQAKSLTINVKPEYYTDTNDDINLLISLSPEVLTKLQHPVIINKEIGWIKIEKEIQTEREEPLNPDEPLDPFANKPNKSESFVDAFGNHSRISTTGYELADDWEIYAETLSITPPNAFDRNPGQDKKTVNLDLSKIELGKLQGMMFIHVESPISFIGENQEYAVYTDIQDPDKKERKLEKLEESLRLIYEGVANAETMFGFEPGSKVKNIYIVDGTQKNAYFDQKNTDTIVISYHNLGDESIRETAFHETIHLFDEEFSISKSFSADHEDFIDFYSNLITEAPTREMLYMKGERVRKRMNPDWLFSYVNESIFMPGGFGGHSWENQSELLASFVNSFTNPLWEHEVMGLSKKHRSQYLQGLETLKTVLEKTPEISKNAPIFGVINEKIEFLKWDKEDKKEK